MLVVLLSVGLVAGLMGGMALGLLRGKRLRGSCGGADTGDCHCAVAGIPEAQRPCLVRPSAQR